MGVGDMSKICIPTFARRGLRYDLDLFYLVTKDGIYMFQ